MDIANLRDFCKINFIDDIGFFKASDYANYNSIIHNLQQTYDFVYRPYSVFVDAGKISSQYKSVIVILKYYYKETESNKDGYKISNYSKYCWNSISPKTDMIIEYIRQNGHNADKINAPEKVAACRAGLGFMGKNGIFYSYKFGSYVAISAIGTDMVLSDEPGEEIAINTFCDSCNKCIQACPVSAIHKEGYRIEPTKCISFINRHPEDTKKEEPEDMSKLNGWLNGCEICQDCCPFNDNLLPAKNAYESNSIDIGGMILKDHTDIFKQDIENTMPTIWDIQYKRYIQRLMDAEQEKN